ncbi:MAG: hypothetical protein UY74_C0031G0003 [Candidatus Kaiserbacteria bacterium GW2011_GWC2_52_8b]|uniref:Uncharacterized protein n=1 Tax=Candidatus Kaiserbacteria bacterium GW2011_GWC2_52_8b TaxID=1618676 RepID=A0A0G1XIR4_9BACT|nr:MAG: hypothetical protein UY74_C0031G0003 [Candidatus Kaiserbacteria bacterium GW2011_GWC2_52_8b]
MSCRARMACMVMEKTLRGIVLAGIFTLPFIILIVAQSMFFPFITGKNFTFRIIVEIITGAWLALALVYPKYRPRRSWILGVVAIFVLVMAIADAQGVYPFKSFWSNYERMDGWVTLIHVFAYLTVASSVINSEKIWRLLFQVTLGVSVFMGLYGFLQLTGHEALGQGGSAGLSSRIDATFGNPIYLAVYMLFHVFIATLLWLQMWHARSAGKRLWPSLAYGAIIVIDTLMLFFTGTRGTMLASFVGVFPGYAQNTDGRCCRFDRISRLWGSFKACKRHSRCEKCRFLAAPRDDITERWYDPISSSQHGHRVAGSKGKTDLRMGAGELCDCVRQILRSAHVWK